VLRLAAAILAMVGVLAAVRLRELRVLNDERQRQAVTDDLTGLGNRRFLLRVLDGFFADLAAGGGGRELAFLFVDLNGFKEVNDCFGHPAGDELLRQLGTRLSASLRRTDALVRVGGDEFALLLLDADAAYADQVAQRITERLSEPFQLDGVRARVGASIGIALAPRDATASERLVWCADAAMYRAKLGGMPVARYESEHDDAGSRLLLADDLRRSLAAGRLELHYQPLMHLRSGEVHAVEALLRWPHPSLGLVAPLKFLPLAEEANLMGELTQWVLGEALAQVAAWRAEGLQLSVSVNVSASNLEDPDFPETVCELLQRARLPAEALVLEVTETSIISDFERSRTVIERLRGHGVVVSIDDFGAGFTSLAHLSSLAVRELKLDRAFIAGLSGSERELDLRLLRATIDLGHALGLRVVTEGIEDAATLELLTELGCDLGQGYFIGRPRPAHQLDLRRELDLCRASDPAGLLAA
jgi:diguanylate cyclase (GGDEF)-like protein